MLLYFKKRKFRNHIRKCGILEDLNIQSYGLYAYKSVVEGLHDWEKEILREELKIINQEKEERKTQEQRKVFFNTWKI